MNEDEIKKKVKIKFSDLPISRLTQNGLKKRNFKVMTEIQRCVLPHALADSNNFVNLTWRLTDLKGIFLVHPKLVVEKP